MMEEMIVQIKATKINYKTGEYPVVEEVAVITTSGKHLYMSVEALRASKKNVRDMITIPDDFSNEE